MDARALLLFVLVVGCSSSDAATQYHAQDEWGQYAYGYAGGPSAKHEQRTADGVTLGGYSYVDAHGVVQSVSYASDPVNGFRAAGTNFPTADHHAVPVVVGYHVAPVPAVVRHVPAAASSVHTYSSAVVHDAPAAASSVHTYGPVVVRHVPAAASSVHTYGSTVVHDAPAAASSVHSYGSTVVHDAPAIASDPHHHELHPAVLLAARRKKRSVVGPYYYPAGPAVVLHHRAAVVVKPVATSYTSVTRHEPAAAVPVAHVYHAAVPVVVRVPHVYHVNGFAAAGTADIPVHHV